MPRSPNAAKERFWLQHLRRWQTSHLTIRDYCQQHDLAEASFYAWRRTLNERGFFPHTPQPSQRPFPSDPPVFVPVTFPNTTGQPNPAIEVVLPSGHLLRVTPGFDTATLRQLLDTLEQRPC